MFVISVINALAPVILMIGLGVILKKAAFLDTTVCTGMNRFVYWVGLPCLLFHKIATATFSGGAALPIFYVLLITTGIVACIAFLGSFWQETSARGAFMQAAFRGNLAYVGLPIVFFSFSAESATDADRMQALAVLAIAPLVPVYNVLAAIVLSSSQRRAGKRSAVFKKTLINVAENPLIIACVAGLFVKLSPIQIPLVFERTFQALGDTALPLALLGIGVSIATASIGGNFMTVFTASILKLILSPLIALAFSVLLGLSGQMTQIALILAACPTAVASYVMAQQMGADAGLASRAVVVSTVGAFPVFAVILLAF